MNLETWKLSESAQTQTEAPSDTGGLEAMTTKLLNMYGIK